MKTLNPRNLALWLAVVQGLMVPVTLGVFIVAFSEHSWVSRNIVSAWSYNTLTITVITLYLAFRSSSQSMVTDALQFLKSYVPLSLFAAAVSGGMVSLMLVIGLVSVEAFAIAMFVGLLTWFPYALPSVIYTLVLAAILHFQQKSLKLKPNPTVSTL